MSHFPVITLIQSVKRWQKSYFYVKNVAPQGDYVNLPAYVAGPPAGRRPQWSYRAVTLSQAGAAAVARLRVMIQSEGLTGSDLLAAFLARRVLPLQSCPHLICQMSGQLDPSRMCTKDMSHDEVAHMVNYLANCKLSGEWRFGKEPYSHAHPPPTVCSLFPFLLLVLSPSSFWPTLTSRHVLAEPSLSTCGRDGGGSPISPRPGGA